MSDALQSMQSELTALRARVHELEDREAIRQLTAEYMQAMHDARWEDAVACFAEEASYDHGILGELVDKQAIRHFYTEFMPGYEEAGGWAFDVLADPVIAALSATNRERHVFTDKELAGAIAYASTLSWPVVADRLPPMIAAALN